MQDERKKGWLESCVMLGGSKRLYLREVHFLGYRMDSGVARRVQLNILHLRRRPR